ncbi:MAG: helix-turn-helix domain-containing protein [Christensenellaceae bacterium]|nr:helix-turn-helix domain-containing protein [Christensenellaceae bacterium]
MNRSATEFNAKSLGMRIKRARQEQGYTLEKLADICMVTSVHLRHVENGARFPSLPVFAALCSALNVSPSYFMPECLSLPHDLPDAYERALRMLMDAPPRHAQIVVAMLETMHGMLDLEK